MSHAHAGSCEALGRYTRDEWASTTPAVTHQRQFAQRLRGVLRRINAQIRAAVVERDLFNLQGNESEALVDEPPDRVFQYPKRRQKIAGFLAWLRSQLQQDYLTVVGPDRNQFLRAAYAQGLRNVHTQLSELDVGFERPDTDTLLSRPVHRSALQELYTRAYSDLQSVSEDVESEVRDTLVEGFQEGESPSTIARNLTDRVNSIGKHRSTLIARSETMNAHSQSSLNRIDELNESVENEIAAGHGEFDAAVGSPRTCAFCRRLSGTPLTTSEMASGVVQFRGDVFRLGPPAHPHGRCRVGVSVGGGPIDTPLSERLPAGITVVSS